MNARRLISCLAALGLLAHAGESQAQTADLTIVKTLTTPAIPPAVGINLGDNIVYSIVVTNNGPSTATGVTVNDPTPAGVSFVSNSGDCTTAYPCSLGSIAPASSKSITTTYLVPSNYDPPTAVGNTATVSSASTDPDPFNDTSFVVTAINGQNCGNFSVSCGTAHTCAVVAGNGKAPPNTVEDDLIECWGSNPSGESSPVPAGSYAQVSAGSSHTCALTTTGAVACWGYDGDGIVTDTPTATDFVQIDSGFGHTCGLRSGGSIECWGSDFFGEATPPAGTFSQVACGNVHSCALRNDGTVHCWGFDGDVDESGDPIVTGGPTGNDFVEIVAGGEHACARHQDGTVDCWGSDYSGEGSDPTGTFLTVAAGDEHNCGLRSDNTVDCWGDDGLGQSTPPGDAFTSIDAGAYHTCGLVSDGTILCWGDNFAFHSVPPTRSDLCPICGDNVLEGREECEACADLEFCSPLTPFAACCSPVTCTAYRLSENHVCRAASGACDAPETCDGVNFATCPAPGPLRPAGYVCRGAVGSCDPEETCTGTSDQCPPSLPFLPSTTVCRAMTGSCDVAENCTGSSAACPADVLVAASTVCRASAGVCDIEDVCTGVDPTCPDDAVKTSAVTCRPSAGVCDSAEVCSGEATCPDNDFLGSEVTCRPSSAICDAAEVCSGTAAACPADGLASSSTPCRAANGGCDAVEFCTGLTTICPPDLFALPGTTCRTAVSVCDVAEACLGTSGACPADQFSASTVTCRAAVDVCDVAERCTGASSACPANVFAVPGTPCDDNAFCNGSDTCNGSGSCSLHSGSPCPGPDNDGNCAESCNEASDNCTSLDPNGSSCSDGDACSSGETCTNGTCAGGTVTECDDGDVCTFDTCDLVEGCVHLPGIEETGCLDAGKGQLFITNHDFPEKSKLKWAWKNGDVLSEALLGTPTVDAEYALCIFDRNLGSATLVGSYTIPAATAGWKEKPGRVVFVNKDAPPEGIFKMNVKASQTPAKSGSILKGKGNALDLFDPVAAHLYLYHEPSVVAQLRNSEGMCLTTEFFAPDFRKNWDNQVKAAYKR